MPNIKMIKNRFIGYLFFVLGFFALGLMSKKVLIIGFMLLIIGIIRKNFVPTVGFAVGALAAYLFFMISFFIPPILKDYMNRKAFDSQVWKESLRGDDYKEVRLRMVDDLLKKHNLIGMSKEEIDKLLGVPPKTSYFKKYDYVYRLGQERDLIPIDSEWLVIKFENGKVAAACLTRD